MNIERITSVTHPLYQKAMELYNVSFPPHEQRETHSQNQILMQDAYHFDIICDEGEFVGEILYWEIAGFFYIEHFCVLPAMRNKHYGQRILNAYQVTPLILEIDPSYHAENQGHELVIMSSPIMLEADEYESFNRYLRDVVMKDVY